MSKTNELREVIKNQLATITAGSHPFFYELLNSPDGYQRAEDMIIRYAITNRMSIGATLAQLESEME